MLLVQASESADTQSATEPPPAKTGLLEPIRKTGKSAQSSSATKPSSNSDNASDSGDSAADAGSQFGDDELLALYKNRKLFSKNSYSQIRHIFARRFEADHQQQISRAYGSELAAMNAWLDKNLDIKEEFYLAINPRRGNIVGALSLFKEIKDRFPDKIVPYANLAIATAVTWDRSGRGVYDYLFRRER